LSQQGGAQTEGPLQNNLGRSPAAAIGGVNTASGVTNQTSGLIDAVTQRSNVATDRGAAQIRESFGAQGNRLSTGLARTEGQFRNEAGFDLSQIIAGINNQQAGRETQAAQFDASANNQILQILSGIAGTGILPEELLVSPGIGSQILSGLLQTGASFAGRPSGINLPQPATRVQEELDPRMLGA
jgi:hypothetical protein